MTEYGIWGVLYSSLQTAILASIRYWLFKDNLRISAKLSYALLAVMSFGGGGLWLAGCFPGISFTTVRALLGLFMFAVSSVIIKEPFAKHAFAYAFVAAYSAVVEMCGTFMQARVVTGGAPGVYVITCLVLIAVSVVPYALWLRRMVDRLVAMDNDRVWGALCFICFSFLLMNLLFTFPAKPELKYVLSRFMMLLGMVAIYRAAIHVMDQMSQTAEARAVVMLTERRVAMQQEYYDRLITQMEEVRRIRHDFKHHHSALTALIQSGDTAALTAYISNVEGLEDAPPVTGGIAFDSLLFYYSEKAKSLGAQVETDVAFAAPPMLSDPELCVLLGNLLENAVDAQAHVAEKLRYIRVSARSDKTGFTLAVDNRFDGGLIGEPGAYRTRKPGDGHGYGLASVRAVCERYNGVFQIEQEGDMFMAGVVIGV